MNVSVLTDMLILEINYVKVLIFLIKQLVLMIVENVIPNYHVFHVKFLTIK